MTLKQAIKRDFNNKQNKYVVKSVNIGKMSEHQFMGEYLVTVVLSVTLRQRKRGEPDYYKRLNNSSIL